MEQRLRSFGQVGPEWVLSISFMCNEFSQSGANGSIDVLLFSFCFCGSVNKLFLFVTLFFSGVPWLILGEVNPWLLVRYFYLLPGFGELQSSK